MRVIHEDGSRPIKLWTDDIEEGALQQLKNIAKLPFIAPNGVAAMPDVHWGIGATVGSVIATKSAIIPAAVGVDIGCGMVAGKTNLKLSMLPDSLGSLRNSIERAVPLGTGGHHKTYKGCTLPRITSHRLADNLSKAGFNDLRKAEAQVGTLGSGNHFIEICGDQDQNVWIMLHSGSRGVGNRLGTHFIAAAKEEMRRYFIDLPDDNLAYLPEGTPLFEEYSEAVLWAQDYARMNRDAMFEAVLAQLQHEMFDEFVFLTDKAINCHHNYVERENHFGENYWVTRKGAIRARDGDLGIIPGSMGQRSYIVRGKGVAESFSSCSHGAGRKFGRKEARKKFTIDDLRAQTEGVECRKDDAVLDEIPGAYKDIDTVMENQRDLVEVVATLKQVLCVKGA